MMLHQLSNSHSCACAAEIASRVKYGQQTFLRFPENLLNSRARYAKAFQVSFFSSDVCLCSGCLLVCLSTRLCVCLSVRPFVCLCASLPTCLSVCLTMCQAANIAPQQTVPLCITCQHFRISKPYRDAQDRLLWRDKTCPACT